MGSTQTAVGITGASGLIGRALCSALAEKEIRVVAWTRDSDKLQASFNSQEQKHITCVPYQLGEKLHISAPIQVSTIVHAAVDLKTFPLGLRDQINVSGARALLADRCASQVKRWVFLSSLSAHSDALSHYGRSKCEIEKLFLAQPGGLIVRPGLVLGPKGVYANIARSLVRLPIAPVFWKGTQPMQIIPLENLVSGLVKLVHTDQLPLREWNLARPDAITLREFYREISRATGRKIWLFPMPGELALATMRFSDWLSTGLRFALPLGSEQLLGLKASRVWSTQPALDALELKIPSFKEWLSAQNHGSLPRTPQIQSEI